MEAVVVPAVDSSEVGIVVRIEDAVAAAVHHVPDASFEAVPFHPQVPFDSPVLPIDFALAELAVAVEVLLDEDKELSIPVVEHILDVALDQH